METDVTAFRGTYRRGPDGVWRYPWGDPVAGARDVLLSEVLELFRTTSLRDADPSALTRADVEEVARRYDVASPLFLRTATGRLDVIVGLAAPELDAAHLMTVADVAEAANVSKATIDSYRYRGHLPEPQIVAARTPLWARPIIGDWLTHRPGTGWRSDVYGRRQEPERTLPITRARERLATRPSSRVTAN